MLSISLFFWGLLRLSIATSTVCWRESDLQDLVKRSNLCFTRSIKITLFGREFGWGGTFNKR